MYRIMYKKHESNDWQCIGAYADIETAIEEMDKLEHGILGDTGSFKIKREGSKNERDSIQGKEIG